MVPKKLNTLLHVSYFIPSFVFLGVRPTGVPAVRPGRPQGEPGGDHQLGQGRTEQHSGTFIV